MAERRFHSAATTRRAPGWLLALLCAATLCGSASGPARADPPPPGTGSVRGSLRVYRGALFGGLREASDHGGALVYVTGFASTAPEALALLHQRGEQFEPRLLPVVAGQGVSFPNHDRIYHNVFSVSPLEAFDLGQYKSQDPPRTVRFEKPGLVPVFCNIHPQMLSYVAVLENDAYAVTDEDGAFEIAGLPPGALELQAWMPGARRVTVPIAIEAGAERVVDLRLEQIERIAPHKRKDGSDYPKPRYEDE